MFTFVRIITCDCHVVTTSVKSWSCEPIAAIGGGGGAWQPMYRNQDGWGYLQCWWLEEEKGGALGLRLGRFRMMMCWPGHRCSSSPWWGTWWDHSTGSHLQCFTISAGYDPNYSHRTISPGLLANLIKKIVKNHFVNLPGLGWVQGGSCKGGRISAGLLWCGLISTIILISFKGSFFITRSY